MWGTAGVIRAEQPQLWGGLVDLADDADIDPSALSTILRTPSKTILALRDGELLTRRWCRVRRADASRRVAGRFGLPDHRWPGALGLLMAGWLADRAPVG